MFIIPIITDDTVFAATVKRTIECGLHPSSGNMQAVIIDNFDDALDYFNMEMPDLAFIDFSSDKVKPFGLLDTIIGDPWLLHAGIIAFCRSTEEERNLGDLKKVNIIDIVRSSQVELLLPKIMGIIATNRQILFQRVIGTDIPRSISAAIQLENDLHAASCYANLLANFLYNTNKIDREGKAGLAMVMHELLINAIEHGNCEISYDEKTALLDSGGDVQELINERCKETRIGDRKVTFEYTITGTSSTFRIADAGGGFDWHAVPDPTKDDNFLLSHGRGILMARSFTKCLTFNEKGNEVEFQVAHVLPDHCVMPGIFKDIEPTVVAPGDIILCEGDRSDFIFYIVSGEFDVLVGGTIVSTLSEEDLFLGEMAFLLEHRRTATVRAKTAGRLIKVNKREFVEAIKKKPHYALLLARLLAKRIERINAIHVLRQTLT
jgi:hypothetical protein